MRNRTQFELTTPEKSFFSDSVNKKLQRLGKTTLEGAGVSIERDKFFNHDPLAHVWLVAEQGSSENLERQIYTEFITDIGERAQLLPFDHEFAYRFTGDDFIAETGVSMRQMLDFGLAVAESDRKDDPLKQYALERARVQAGHYEQLKQWMEGDGSKTLLIASLAPPIDEVPLSVAKAAGFKTERGMASIWLFEKTESNVVAWKAFSLDQYGLEDLKNDLWVIGGDSPKSYTTLQLLGECIGLDISMDEVQRQLIKLHDSRLEQQNGRPHTQGIPNELSSIENANQKVIDHPEAYSLYRALVSSAAESLSIGQVSKSLAALVSGLGQGFANNKLPVFLEVQAGQQVDADTLRHLFDYVRKQAIPHYVFSARKTGSASPSYESSGGGIAQAGAEAAVSKLEYEGACPSSKIGIDQTQGTHGANPDTYALRAMAEALGLRLSSGERSLFADFGTPKKGICRFSDCSSRGIDKNGNIRKSNAKKTTVGGCDLCVTCHVTIKEDGYGFLRKKHQKIVKQWQQKIQKAAAKPILKDTRKPPYAKQ